MKLCAQPEIGTGSFSNFHTSMILVFESMADFWLVRGRSPNITCAHSCYCSQYERILLQFPPSISPLPCFFSPCHVLHHNLPCYGTKGLMTCQVACAKCLVACYIALALQMCMTWIQTMSGNPKVRKGCKRQTGGKRIAAVLLYCLH